MWRGVWAAAVVVWGLAAGIHEASAQTLNMSHDLVSLGIASQNLVPNDPALDARPLFQAASEYVRTHDIRVLTLDHGAYYFLTPQFAGGFVVVPELVDVTIDLAGSTLYFANARPSAIQLYYCQRVTLTNFTVEYLSPPYTHTRLTSVDPVNRRLHYEVLPGWFDPVAFAADASPIEVSNVVALAFRDGDIVPGTTRMPVEAVTAGRLDLFQNTAPWTQGPTLSTLRPGDTLVVTNRSGNTAVLAWFSDAVTISHVRIHGSSGWALALEQTGHSVVEHVRIEPGPGALLGSTSDGIHVRHDQGGNVVRNCYVTRTVDDALVLDALSIGTVLSQPGARTLVVRRDIYTRFPNGTRVSFVDPTTAAEMDGGVIVSQDPPDSRNTEFNGTVTLQFDRDVSALPAGATMAFADSAMRGLGSRLEDNVVEDIPFGRGVWIGGTIGSTVQRNVIRRTSSGAVTVYQTGMGDAGPPARDLVIQSNVLEGSMGPAASGTGTQTSLAAIIVVSVGGPQFRFSHVPVNTNVQIRDNFIVDSGRGGIWVGQTAGGVIENNAILRWYQRPHLPIWGIPPDLQEQVYDDFRQPIVMRSSTGVSTAGNQLVPYSVVPTPVVIDPPVVVLPAAGGSRTVFVYPALTSLQWTPTTADSWITVPVGARSGLVPLEIAAAPNASPLARTGHVLAAGQQVTVMQAGAVPLATPGHIALGLPTVGGNEVTLSWSAPVGGAAATSFTVVASLTPGGPAIAVLNVGAAQNVTVGAPDGAYFVRVFGSNAVGAGPLSNEILVVVGQGTVPSAPRYLTAFVRGSVAMLAWGAPGNATQANVEAYVIEAGNAPGLSNLASFAISDLSGQYSSPPLPNGSYYVRVRARNATGLGPPSAEVRVIVGPPPPAAPVLTGGVNGPGAVALSWTASSGGVPVTGYELRAGTTPGASNVAVLPLPASQLAFGATGVPPGRYYVRVVALSAQGPSEESNEVTLIVP